MAHPRHDDRTRSLLNALSSTGRTRRLAMVAAPLVTLSAVAAGIALTPASPSHDDVSALRLDNAGADLGSGLNDDRDHDLGLALSRSAGRGPIGTKRSLREQSSAMKTRRASWFRVGHVVDHEYSTVPLNVRMGPGEDFARVDLLDEDSRVAITGREDGPWAEIAQDGRALWVHRQYLTDKKPVTHTATTSGSPAITGGLSSAPCPSSSGGSSVESGLTANAIALHRAVCAAFPQITTYGGYRSSGDHTTGQSVDIMIPDSSTGNAIAAFVRSNYSALHVNYIMWSQQIWSVERSSEGWRFVADRGSVTANHYDHVHVTVY